MAQASTVGIVVPALFGRARVLRSSVGPGRARRPRGRSSEGFLVARQRVNGAAPGAKAFESSRLLQRTMLSAASAFLSINIWTGSPLLALWLGSRVAEEQALSFKPIAVVVLSLAVFTLAISVALGWVENRYRKVAGLPPREARMTWLRAFNAQREPVRHVPTSAPERVVTVVVYLAVIALVVWLVFFSGSSVSSEFYYA